MPQSTRRTHAQLAGLALLSLVAPKNLLKQVPVPERIRAPG
jgi:hypothetical protein